MESAASNLVSHTMKSTGKCNIKKYTLSECKKKQKPVKCSSCKHIFKTFVGLTKHMSRRYIQISSTNASTALKTFNPFSWKYQHQARYKRLSNKCPWSKYSKLFQFYYQLRGHKKIHKRKPLYICRDIRNCSKGFTT